MTKGTKITIRPRYGLDKPEIIDYEIEVIKGGIIKRLELDINDMLELESKITGVLSETSK